MGDYLPVQPNDPSGASSSGPPPVRLPSAPQFGAGMGRVVSYVRSRLPGEGSAYSTRTEALTLFRRRIEHHDVSPSEIAGLVKQLMITPAEVRKLSMLERKKLEKLAKALSTLDPKEDPTGMLWNVVNTAKNTLASINLSGVGVKRTILNVGKRTVPEEFLPTAQTSTACIYPAGTEVCPATTNNCNFGFLARGKQPSIESYHKDLLEHQKSVQECFAKLNAWSAICPVAEPDDIDTFERGVRQIITEHFTGEAIPALVATHIFRISDTYYLSSVEYGSGHTVIIRPSDTGAALIRGGETKPVPQPDEDEDMSMPASSSSSSSLSQSSSSTEEKPRVDEAREYVTLEPLDVVVALDGSLSLSDEEVVAAFQHLYKTASPWDLAATLRRELFSIGYAKPAERRSTLPEESIFLMQVSTPELTTSASSAVTSPIEPSDP